LVIYGNDNFTWTNTILLNNFYGGTALEVVDFDRDIDLDIIAGASGLGELYLWENLLITTVKGNHGNSIPEKFYLYQNHPNPFNPSTIIGFHILESSFVTLSVYDVLGDEIMTLVNEEKSAGLFEVEFDGTELPTGIYFYQLKTRRFVDTKKMLLLK